MLMFFEMEEYGAECNTKVLDNNPLFKKNTVIHQCQH